MRWISTIYELSKENIEEIKVYGVMDGKRIFYSRAHGLALKFQMQYDTYYQDRILRDVLLYGDRYKQSAQKLGYSFRLQGLSQSFDKSALGKARLNAPIGGYLTGDFKTTGTFCRRKAGCGQSAAARKFQVLLPGAADHL